MNKITVATAISIAFACFTFTQSARADVSLPAIFANGMVLQRDMAVPIWGTANVGEVVTVSGPSGAKTTTADANGKWMLRLEPLKLGAPFDLKIQGNNLITLSNVLAGDVWLASGQSNMEWALINSRDGRAANEAGKANPIRAFLLKKQTAADPIEGYEGWWLGPDKQAGFSAVAYYFGHEVQEKTGVPIGIIGSYWGGTLAEAWTDRGAVAADPLLKPVMDDWQKKLATYPAELDKLNNERLPAWQAAVEKAKAEGKPEPEKPYVSNPNGSNGIGYLWNGMIKPIVPFGIKGVIWYQGESNSGRTSGYDRLFSTLITDWRKQWGQGDFPFYFVQLANNGRRIQSEPVETGWQGWMNLQEAQAKTLSLLNTGMAVTIDLADDPQSPGDVHYLNKTDVGKRLARWALAKDYGQNVPYLSPLFDSYTIEGSAITIHFKGAETGLVSKDGTPLKGFAIAGADKKWVWAEAKIAGESVILSSAEVTNPVVARYDWAQNPIGNLYNGVGLPASPFRTDQAQ